MYHSLQDLELAGDVRREKARDTQRAPVPPSSKVQILGLLADRRKLLTLLWRGIREVNSPKWVIRLDNPVRPQVSSEPPRRLALAPHTVRSRARSRPPAPVGETHAHRPPNRAGSVQQLARSARLTTGKSEHARQSGLALTRQPITRKDLSVSTNSSSGGQSHDVETR